MAGLGGTAAFPIPKHLVPRLPEVLRATSMDRFRQEPTSHATAAQGGFLPVRVRLVTR